MEESTFNSRGKMNRLVTMRAIIEKSNPHSAFFTADEQ